MVAVKQSSLLQQNRISRNGLSSPKRSISIYSDAHQQVEKELKDRVAERFFVKRTRRSYDLSVVSKRNSMLQKVQQLKTASAKIDYVLKGLGKPSSFYLGPKVPSSPEDRKVFATPKHYVCEGCNAKLLSVPAYVKHLRKHKVNIRCSGCDRCFDHVVDKRHHELRCPKKIKLRL